MINGAPSLSLLILDSLMPLVSLVPWLLDFHLRHRHRHRQVDKSHMWSCILLSLDQPLHLSPWDCHKFPVFSFLCPTRSMGGTEEWYYHSSSSCRKTSCLYSQYILLTIRAEAWKINRRRWSKRSVSCWLVAWRFARTLFSTVVVVLEVQAQSMPWSGRSA